LSDYGAPPPPPPPPPPPGGFQSAQGVAVDALANWGQRVGAYLIDYALILLFIILRFLFSPKVVITNVGGTIGTVQSGGSAPLAFLMSLIALAIWAYNRWYLGGQGQSFGKRTLGLTLVAESTGQPIGMAKAFLRDLLHFLDGICFVGYLFPLWDQKRQTFADKIMTTVVTTKP
jgi:uncharacterized RDD family membrane protein YckC